MKELVVPYAVYDADGVSVSLTLGDRVEKVSFATSESVGKEVDFLLPLALLPTMSRGACLKLLGGVSPRLFSTLPKIQDIFCAWNPEFRRVSVDVETRDNKHAERASGVASFFSSGVDSFYTLLKHRDEISHLIFVHGFHGVPLKPRHGHATYICTAGGGK